MNIDYNKIDHLRKTYQKDDLDINSMSVNPYQQFDKWFKEANENEEVLEVNAMVLACADDEGRPSARMVLLKGYNEQGFVFYTNYNSRKAKAIAENPTVALLFYWDVLERQIRIEGKSGNFGQTIIR